MGPPIFVLYSPRTRIAKKGRTVKSKAKIGFWVGIMLRYFRDTVADRLSVSFGDNVRVRSTPLTVELGVAGLVGNVFGETTPSVTGVEVIGEPMADHAVNVFFEEKKKGLWFAPGLLEFIDHAPGAEIRLDGVPKKWIRSETGEWKEIDTAAERPRSWWRFWSH